MSEGNKRLINAVLNGNISESLKITECQCNSQRELLLPQNMVPKREIFESAGFIFEDIGDDVLHYQSYYICC